MPFYYRDIIRQLSLPNGDQQVKLKVRHLHHLDNFYCYINNFYFSTKANPLPNIAYWSS